MKKTSIPMTTLHLSTIIIFGWLIFRATHPAVNLWEESRSTPLLLKLLEPSTPVFITLWTIAYGYHMSISKSNKVTHVIEKKDLEPVINWGGVLAWACLLTLVSLNLIDQRIKNLATRIEHIIALCDNDRDLQNRYLLMNNSTDLKNFVSLALQKGRTNPDVARVVDSLGYY